MARFRGRICRRTFPEQTFPLFYYLKRPELTLPVATRLVADSAHCQLARSLLCAPTPAMVLGLAREPRLWEEVLRGRIFPHRVTLPPEWEKIYRRDLPSPSVGRNERHSLRQAS